MAKLCSRGMLGFSWRVGFHLHFLGEECGIPGYPPVLKYHFFSKVVGKKSFLFHWWDMLAAWGDTTLV